MFNLLLGVVVVIFVIAISFLLLQISGKNSLYSRADDGEVIGTLSDMAVALGGSIDVEEEEDICPIGEDDYRINGTTDLGDVEELLGIAFEDDEDYDTLGGYLIGRLGRIPDEEEKPEISVSGWLFQVESIEEKRIEKVRTIRAPEEQAEEE